VDSFRPGVLIQPKPEVSSRNYDFSSLLKKSPLVDLGVRKELAGLVLTVIEKDIDVRRPICFQMNLKIIVGAQHAAFINQDFGITPVGFFSLADDVHAESQWSSDHGLWKIFFQRCFLDLYWPSGRLRSGNRWYDGGRFCNRTLEQSRRSGIFHFQTLRA